MAETVNVSSSPGPNYSWSSGTFTWGSATAGKNWSTAYPAVYALSVATDLSFAELVQKLGIKRSSESLAFAEKPSRAVTLSKFETLNFVETYTDLIAFVLRFVESLTFSEKYARSGTKAVFEVFQVAEGRRGVALLSIDGQPAKPFLVGTAVDESLKLQAVAHRRAELADVKTGLVVHRLELPAEAPAQLPAGIKLVPAARP